MAVMAATAAIGVKISATSSIVSCRSQGRRSGSKPAKTNEVNFRRRRAQRRDPLLDVEEVKSPFVETQKRMVREEGKRVLIDVENLINQSSNKFGLALEIAEEANEFLRNNKEAALTQKPVFRAIADRINEGAGETVTNAYLDFFEDYSEFESLGREDAKEK